MNWSKTACQEIEKIPAFIKPRVKAAIETYAVTHNIDQITVDTVKQAKTSLFPQHQTGNEPEAKQQGSQVDKNLCEVTSCNGDEKDCPFLVGDTEKIKDGIEKLLADINFTERYAKKLPPMTLQHHIFKITIAGCSNGCPQPQIKDIGIIPKVKVLESDRCDLCGACIGFCPDKAVAANCNKNGVTIDRSKCINCGACVAVCETEALSTTAVGCSILVGGKLGRHPQLAEPLEDFVSADKIVELIRTVLTFFLEQSKGPEKMAQFINRVGIETIRALPYNR